MTKGQLIKWSMARDTLDLIGIGQIPPLNWMLDVPILCMHFMYAGSKALVTLPELIPIVGTLPIFTIAAICYPNHDGPADGGATNSLEPVPARPVAASFPILPAPQRLRENEVKGMLQ